jgi:hypothetical protein
MGGVKRLFHVTSQHPSSNCHTNHTKKSVWLQRYFSMWERLGNKTKKTSLVRSRLHKVLLFFIGHSTAFWVVRPPSLLSLTSLKIFFFFFKFCYTFFLGLLCGSVHVWGFSWPGEATASVEDIRNNRHWPTFVLLSSDVGYFGDLDDYWKCFF